MNCNVNDLVTYVSRGVAPKYTEETSNSAIVINQKCIRDYRVNLDLSRLNDLSKRKVSDEKMVQQYDVLVNSTGVGTLGRVAQYLDDTSNLTVDTHVTIVRPNHETIDPLFFGYLMKSKQKLIESFATGTTGQTELSRDSIKEMAVDFISDKTKQKGIASFLLALDSKLQVNYEINQNLEQMAQTLFKSWFVDFDPVKAKMNGKQPEGMDAATASLFPEKLVDSELGLIPEGWDAVQVGDIVQRLKPEKRYTKKQVEPYGKTPVYEQGASILLGFHNDDAGFDASPEDPVFIFGDHTCITHLSCSKFDISSNVIPLKGSLRPTIWTYYAIQGKQEFQEYRRHWSEFIIKDVVLPPLELAEKYAELVTTKYLIMESLKRQSKELEQLRDALLPKLLSGEIELGQEIKKNLAGMGYEM